MKVNSLLIAVFACLTGVVLLMPSCEKHESCGESNISSAGSNESHNMGKNCMECHTSGGEGEGCFNVAGTAYNAALTSTLGSGTIKFYSGPNGTGTLVKTVAIDSKGNFHTTESVNVTNLYPAITGPGGTTQYMSSKPATGACNSCHGSSTDRLWAN